MRGRRRNAAVKPKRALTASAKLLTPNPAGPGAASSTARDGWQSRAWDYRFDVPEVGYAATFLGNIAARMQLYPALASPTGEPPDRLDEGQDTGLSGGSDGPSAVPAQYAADAAEQVARLGEGRSHAGEILGPMAEIMEIPGEGRLVLQNDLDADDGEYWSFRSRDEIRARDGKWYICDTPADREGVELGHPDDNVWRVHRPNRRYSGLAYSPMQPLLGECESLLVTGRELRSATRSRIPAGILVLSNDLRLAGENQLDPVTGQPYTEAAAERAFSEVMGRHLRTPVEDEGSVSALVPMLLRAPSELIEKCLHLVSLARAEDPKLLDRINASLRRIATGLDIPAEVILGVADVNHWTAWQIERSTFTNHVEPLVQLCVDALTAAVLRPALTALGWPRALVQRTVLWYDPAAVIAQPTRSADADEAHDRLAISDATYRQAKGFAETDAPDDAERARRIEEARVLKGSRTLTGGDPTGGAGDGGTTPSPDDPTAADTAASARTAGLPRLGAHESRLTVRHLARHLHTLTDPRVRPAAQPAGLTAAGPNRVRESDRLREVDSRTREYVHGLASAAVGRVLERASARAGAQLRANGAVSGMQGAFAAARAAGEPLTWHVPRTALAAAGLSDDGLLAGEFGSLGADVAARLASAAEDVIDTAARLAGVDRDDDEVRQTVGAIRDRFAEAADAAWAWLSERLAVLARSLLYAGPGQPGTGEQSATLVPVGLIRGAVAIAGGLTDPGGLTDQGLAVERGRPVGGLGVGALAADLLHGWGQEVNAYTWVYGISVNTFEPHRRLDGVPFPDFGSFPLLTPTKYTGWLGDHMAPGDHDGCHCDYAAMWSDGGDAADDLAVIRELTTPDGVLDDTRALALDDIAAGRLDTTAVATMLEAERVANSRPSDEPEPTPVTDAYRRALAALATS